MHIEVTVTGTRASGRVSAVGAASKYGYVVGQEIFRLSADDYGDWVGELRWRNVLGQEHWDPIRLEASDTRLNATMTTDDCYKDMRRVARARGAELMRRVGSHARAQRM